MRVRIALRNLIFSQLIILIFLAFAYFTWFPNSFHLLGGFTDTALMIIFVDLVLGPLLVFIIYDKNKQNLSFDINILLGIQVAAFVYGAYALYLKHPVYNVFITDSFKVVNASYSSQKNMQLKTLRNAFFTKPIMVYTELPKDLNHLIQFMLEVDIYGKPDLDKRIELYQPITEENIVKILKKQLSKNSLFATHNSKIKLNQFLKKNGGSVSDYAFYPISGNNSKAGILAVKNTTLESVEVIEIHVPI